MPLNKKQIIEFQNAISSYNFPAVYKDFDSNISYETNMGVVESKIKELLLSENENQVKNGLSNVIYWGYAQIGYRDFRVKRFRDFITNDKLEEFQRIIRSNKNKLSLIDIKNINIPEFSGISFISKVLMFLDPQDHPVLDLQISRLRINSNTKSLCKLKFHNQISITNRNLLAYEGWKSECREISRKYYENQYRAVDIERGFFYLLQSQRVEAAQEIYRDF